MLKRIFLWFENRIVPYPESIQTFPSKSLIAFIFSALKGSKLWLSILMIFTIGTGIIEAVFFQFIGIIIDWLGNYTPTELWVEKGNLLLMMLGLLLFSILWSFICTCIRLQVLQGVLPMRLRWFFHRIMLQQSMVFYQNEFSGRISAKVMQTALAVRDTVIIITDILIYVLVYFITSSIILIDLDGWLVIPFLTWLFLFCLILWKVIPKLAKTAQNQADARSLMTGRITDAYTNIATVKLFSHSARESDYVKSSMKSFLVTVHAQMRLATSLETLIKIINTLMITNTAILGIWLWMHGKTTVGALATALAMALRLNGLAYWVMWESAQLFENIGTVQDGMHTISAPLIVTDIENPRTLQVSSGNIDFNQVDFFYQTEKNMLKDFNLHIKAGEKIGLVGRSGAGKTTLTNLLLRFYDIQSGSITIDGQNIQHVSQQSLRSQIGLVTQDTSLLHRSIRDNILYGKPDATEEEMILAAKKAAAHDFIMTLQDAKGNIGYDVEVGERGVKLSGGQRQRIAIARVMLKNAPILILDEATSALDSEVESAIQDNLVELMEGKTVIAIAHRLSTIAAMDRLIVMDSGHIVEIGSHAELIKKDGVYSKLWQYQSDIFLP